MTKELLQQALVEVECYLRHWKMEQPYALIVALRAAIAQPATTSFDKLYKNNAQGIEIERLKMVIESMQSAAVERICYYESALGGICKKCGKVHGTLTQIVLPKPAAVGAVKLPRCDSADADAFIEKHLAIRNYPSNSKNAARAGWEAALDLFAAIASKEVTR